MTAAADAELAKRLADEAAKARKLEVIFGPWWRYYAVPYELAATLYAERSTCPYCDDPLGPLAILPPQDTEERLSAHLDHMDPLSRGGEDSIRNAVYVCRDCNLAKGRQLFVGWLAKLDPLHRERARALYEEKHGHPPEAFQPGTKQARLVLPRHELSFDEAVLRKLFPRPIVSGPPARA